ncbi:MAG: SCP2 sterol-binding domain-containing protein [Bacillota bacterium]|nr:SCP2 sterol-binding domain-containing protein [Bacillota bacterium]
MNIHEVIESFLERIEEAPKEMLKLNGVLQLDIRGEETVSYQFKLSQGNLDWAKGTPFVPTCTIQVSAQDFIKLIEGSMNSSYGLMTGKIRVSGDFSLVMQLQKILQQHQKT